MSVRRPRGFISPPRTKLTEKQREILSQEYETCQELPTSDRMIRYDVDDIKYLLDQFQKNSIPTSDELDDIILNLTPGIQMHSVDNWFSRHRQIVRHGQLNRTHFSNTPALNFMDPKQPLITAKFNDKDLVNGSGYHSTSAL